MDVLQISKEKLKSIVNDSQEYALANGLVMGFPDLPKDCVAFNPFCLIPSKFNSYWFNYAMEIQTIIHLLIHRISNDRAFLKETLQRTIEVDEFTRKLFEIHEQVIEEGLTQNITLGLLRSDYMLNTIENGEVTGLKQVEINTIASGFSGLSSKLHGLHSYILRKLDMSIENFPESAGCSKFAEGIVAARKLYGEAKAVIAFIIEDPVYNFSDQRMLEYDIMRADSEASVIRIKFSDVNEHGSLRNNRLFLFDQEVAVVYYRTAYVPNLYSSEKDWESRLMIERSKAIKCPSIAYHLAGTKKIQQALVTPGVLERFLDNPDQIKKIREVFAGQYSLDLNEEGEKAVKLALNNPENFVMKPQREGGGNNIYGKDIVETLGKIGKTKEREGYILMELIKAPTAENYVIWRGRDVKLCTIISELGIYGVILGSEDKIFENYTCGHMLRSKTIGTMEGGIVAGYAALDLPWLA